MTAVKQVSVCSERHLRNIKAHLDWNREKALAHDTQNIIDEDRWFEEMHASRDQFHHNEPGKAGARCTYMQHVTLNFNPDECSCNGGEMTPERCMDYVRDFIQARYRDHECLVVLHREHCESDGTDRFAAHVTVNRNNLVTGLRLNEGPARTAAKSRAGTVRALDEKYGLRQPERGQANSRVHGRQHGAAERDMARKGQGERSENERARLRSPSESRRSGASPTAPTEWRSCRSVSHRAASSSSAPRTATCSTASARGRWAAGAG